MKLFFCVFAIVISCCVCSLPKCRLGTTAGVKTCFLNDDFWETSENAEKNMFHGEESVEKVEFYVRHLNKIPKGFIEGFPNLDTLEVTVDFSKLNSNFFGRRYENVKKLLLNQRDFSHRDEYDVAFDSDFIQSTFPNLEDLTVVGPTNENSFRHLDGLKELKLHSSIKQLSKGYFSDLKNMNYLKLVSRIEQLDDDVFANNVNLKKLDLNFQSIEELSENLLKSLSNLEKVSIQTSHLKTLSENLFAGNINLKEVVLIMYYGTEELPEKIFFPLKNLERLHLHSKDVENFHEDTLKFNRKVKDLHLSLNSVDEFPENAFSSLVDLESLILKINAVLSNKICEKNQKIVSLDLKFPGFREIDNIIASLPNLEYLNIPNNDITNLNETTFANSARLKILNLRGNSLKRLHPDVFKSLIHLEELNLERTRLETLDENLFKYNVNLKKLNLADNELMELPEKIFSRLENLEELNLQFNKWQTLSNKLFVNNKKLNTKYLKIEYINVSY